MDDDDVDNPLDLVKKHGDLIVLPNEFVWVVLLLKFAVFIHDPKNARLSNMKLVDAFIKNMGTKYYFLKEWAKAHLFVEGETTVPVSVPTELQQQQLLKQLLGAYCRGNEQEFNHLLVSAGLPCPVPMLHNNDNNNNFLAWSLSPGVASAPIHATAAFSSQMGQQLVLPGVRRSFGTSLNNAPYYASIMSGAPFQQHPPVASLPPPNNYYNIDRDMIVSEIIQTMVGNPQFAQIMLTITGMAAGVDNNTNSAMMGFHTIAGRVDDAQLASLLVGDHLFQFQLRQQIQVNLPMLSASAARGGVTSTGGVGVGDEDVREVARVLNDLLSSSRRVEEQLNQLQGSITANNNEEDILANFNRQMQVRDDRGTEQLARVQDAVHEVHGIAKELLGIAKSNNDNGKSCENAQDGSETGDDLAVVTSNVADDDSATSVDKYKLMEQAYQGSYLTMSENEIEQIVQGGLDDLEKVLYGDGKNDDDDDGKNVDVDRFDFFVEGEENPSATGKYQTSSRTTETIAKCKNSKTKQKRHCLMLLLGIVANM